MCGNVHSQDPDETPCPVCGEPYDQRIIVERGDRWPDVFGGTPLTFFEKYARRCSVGYDAERERSVGGGKQVVYFHDDGPAGR